VRSKKRIRVFVVDDSAVTLQAICSLLETQQELEVVGTARNGFELLAKAEALKPDLVITDIHMPRMNGLECTLRLRELMPATRFITLTDSASPSVRDAQLAVAADGYLDEKVMPEELMREIHRLFPQVFARSSDGGEASRTQSELTVEHPSEPGGIRC